MVMCIQEKARGLQRAEHNLSSNIRGKRFSAGLLFCLFVLCRASFIRGRWKGRTKQRHGYCAYFLSLSRDSLSKRAGRYKQRDDVRSRNSRSAHVSSDDERRNKRHVAQTRMQGIRTEAEEEDRGWRQVTRFNIRVFAGGGAGRESHVASRQFSFSGQKNLSPARVRPDDDWFLAWSRLG